MLLDIEKIYCELIVNLRDHYKSKSKERFKQKGKLQADIRKLLNLNLEKVRAGLLDFYLNGGRNKTSYLPKLNDLYDQTDRLVPMELQRLKKFSELNVLMHKDGSVDMLLFRFIASITVVIGFLWLSIGLAGWQEPVTVYAANVEAFFVTLLADHPVLIIFKLLLYCGCIIFGLALLVSLIFRHIHLDEATELDRILAKTLILQGIVGEK